MSLLQSQVLFDFKVLSNCLEVSLAHFVMTHECHFHLAVSEDGCAFFHLYIFGFNTIIGYMVDHLCCIMSPCYVGLCCTQILKSYFWIYHVLCRLFYIVAHCLICCWIMHHCAGKCLYYLPFFTLHSLSQVFSGWLSSFRGCPVSCR